MEFGQKIFFREINLFAFTNFFHLDFFKFSGLLCHFWNTIVRFFFKYWFVLIFFLQNLRPIAPIELNLRLNFFYHCYIYNQNAKSKARKQLPFFWKNIIKMKTKMAKKIKIIFLRHRSKHRIVAANRWTIFVVLRFCVAHLIKVRLQIQRVFFRMSFQILPHSLWIKNK